MKYQTKDFFISACLLATGAHILHTLREPNNTCHFIFDISPEAANELIRKHWGNKLLLPTRALNQALHELKSRIYQP